MLRLLTILLLFVASTNLFGQSGIEVLDSDSLIQIKSDSVGQRFSVEREKLDSLMVQVNKLEQIDDPVFLDSTKASITHRYQQLDSAENAYQSKLQKLTSLDLPPGKLNSRIDSLNRAQENVFTKINGNVDKLEKRVREKATKLKAKLTGGGMKQFGDSLGVKGMGSPDLSIANLDGKGVDEVNGLELDAGVDLPENLGDGTKIDDPLKDMKGDLQELTSTPGAELRELTNIAEISKAKDAMGEVKEVTSEVSEYTEDLSKISEGEGSEKLTEMAEGKARRAGGLEELTRHEKRLEALKAEREKQLKLVQQYQDKDQIRKQLEDRTKNVANEELLAKNDKVQDAAKNLGKYKKKYSEIQSINNLPKRPPNPMKGKPLRERLLPGVVFQFQKTDLLSVYAAPQFNYHLNKRWVAGAGLVFRLRGTITDSLSYVGDNFVYGYKTFANFKVYKGFGLRAEWEPLRVGLPLDDKVAPFKDWISGYFLGIDKGFTVSRRWRGDTQVLYNFGYKKGETPYANRINFRFGFFMDLTKKQKLPGM